jgi:hypothetical protein
MFKIRKRTCSKIKEQKEIEPELSKNTERLRNTKMSDTEAYRPCPECFLVVAYMDRHRFIEHGVVTDSEADAEFLLKEREETRKKNAAAKLDMVYMGNKGPIAPK